jgi:membrane protein implicated in regulation of membrane protease activity
MGANRLTIEHQARGEGVRAIHFLLLIPYVAMLWVPSYNRAEPAFAGIPFFYWYQLLWIPLASLLLFLVWRAGRSRERKGAP